MKQQQGFSLLEVMVALILLVIMAVGATGYQLFATQKIIEAQYHTQALWIAQQALGQLSASQALRLQYSNNRVTIPLSPGTNHQGYPTQQDCATPSCQNNSNACTGATLQNYFTRSVQCLVYHQPNNALMPGGTLLIDCTQANRCTVTVNWDLPMMVYRNHQNAVLDANTSKVELSNWTAL